MRLRQSDFSRRLWKTSALSTIALAGSGAAHAQDALWQPQVQTIISGDEQGAYSSLEGFIPLTQTRESVVFLDLRLKHDFSEGTGGDVGIGLRRVVNPDLILGGYAYLNVERLDGHQFTGATLGIEAIATNFDAHVNVHLPFGDQSRETSTTSSDLSLVGNQLLEQISVLNRRDYASWGVEGEFGVIAPLPLPKDHSLRLHVGGYHFEDADDIADSITGGKVGFEYKIGNVFDNGASLTFGGEVRHDDRDDTTVAGFARLTIPLGGKPNAAGGEREPIHTVSEGLRKRANERVRGDIGVRLDTDESTSSLTRRAVNAGTGAAFGEFFFADGENTLGLGTLGDPTTLDDAVGKAGSGFVVALGGSGNLLTGGVTLSNGQTVIGGGQSVRARLLDGTTRSFMLGGSDGTVQGTNPANPVLTLGNGNTLRGITVTGGGVGILGNNITGATLTGVTVNGAGGDGASFTGTSTGVNASNFTATGNGGSGLSIAGDGTFNFTGTTLLSGNAVDGLSITGDGTYNFQTVDALDNADDGIEVTSTSGTFTTAGGTISGNGDVGVKIDPIDANVVLTSITHDGGTSGVVLDDVDGSFTVTGATNISNTSGAAIAISNSPASIRFGDVTITNPGADGLSFAGANGPVVVGGIVISGLGAGATGLDFSGSNTTFTAQSVNITGTGAAGSTGIDLSGTLGGSAITITGGGTIGGVDTGVQLGPNGAGAATANANFVFGGGTIAGTTASLDARGLNLASGTYAFGSTVFNGPQLFSVTNIVFVGSAATGAGDGSSVNDLATIATADANGDADAIFVLVNDGAVVNDADGFTLGNGQTLASFGNGAAYALGGVPLNVTGDNVEHGAIQGDPTGNGAATLTNLGAGDTVILGDGTFIANIGISNGAGGSGIFGDSIDGATLTGVTVDGAGLHGAFFTGTATNVSASNFTATGNGGSGLSIDSDGTFNFTGTTTLFDNQLNGLDISGVGQYTFDTLNSQNNDQSGIEVSFASGAELAISGGVVSGNGFSAAQIGGANLDVTLDSVTQDPGSVMGVSLANVSGNFTVTGATTIASSAAGIQIIDGQAEITFGGPVLINGVLGSGGDGLIISQSAGSVSFGSSVDINDADGAGIAISNSTTVVSFDGSVSISDVGHGILVDSSTGDLSFADLVITDPSAGGIEVSGVNGTIDFGNVDITGLGAAIGLNLSGSSSTFTAASLDVAGTNAAGSAGIDLSGTLGGSVTITGGGVIQDVDTGVQLGTNGIGGATANTTFVFGGGSIEGITASLDARGLNPLSGSYGFGATVFNGPQLFDTANIIFVGSAATGAGDGSSVNDLASVDTADANLASDAIFVLVNDGAVVNDADGFTLDDGQTLASFGNGAEYALGGVPLNVTGTNVQHGFIQDDPTGNGAATLTNLGAGDTVMLGDGTIIANIGISNGAGGSGIFGANIDGLTLTGVTVDGAGLHGASFTGTTTNVSASNFTATGNGGSGLSIAGDGAYIFTGITTLSGNTADGLTVSGNGSYTFGTLNAAGNSGGGIAVVSGGSLSIANGTVSGNTTFGVDIADAALDVTLASVSQAGGTSGILLDGVSGSLSVSGGTISNVADSGIDLVGVAANTSFTGITVDTPGLHGISILDPVGGATTTVDSTVIDAADSGIFLDTTQDGADGRIAVTGGDYSGFLGGLVVVPSNPGTYEVAVSGGNFTAQAGAAIFVDGCLCAGDITITEFGGFSAIAAGANTAGVIVNLAEFNVAAGGPITIGTAADPALFGLLMADVTGTLNVSRLDVTSISGPGLGVDNFFLADPTLFQLEIGAGSIASGNQAIYLDGLTTDITLETVSSAGSFGEGILLADLSGSFAVTGTTDISNSFADGLQIIGGDATITFGGPVTVTNSGDDGIDIEDFGGTADFGAVQVDTPAGDGFALNDNTGTLTFGGQTTITNPGVAGVDFNGASGNVSFADLDISLGAANTVGLELAGAVIGFGTTITAGDFDVDGGGFAGTLGIDLSGATGTGLVRLGDTVNPGGPQTSTITNVANGVRFSAATNLGTAVTDGFIFGDGDVPAESLIQTTGGLVLDGTLTTDGRYNFRDATLVGDTSNLSTALTLYYVDDVTDGIDSGTRANPGTIAGAMASGAAAIILVNNTGDADGTIDIFLQPGGATTLDLGINQRLYSFAQGNTLVLPGGAPANFLLTGITSGSITNPGTGTPTLTTTAAAANTITLDSNNTISGVIVQNGAGASSIFGSGINDLALTGSTVGTLNGASLGGLSLTNAAGSAAISTTTLRSLAISGGSVGVNGVDADIAGNGGAIAFSVAGAHSGNIDFDTASTIAQSGAASAVSVVNKAVGAVTFGGLVSASTSIANAVVLTNNAGSTVNFDSGLAITTTTGTGFTATGGGTVNVAATGGAETINSSAGQAIELNGVTAAMALDSVVSAGAANGIRLDGVTGTLLVSGTVDISAMSQAGIVVQNTPAGGLTTTFQGQVDIDNSATAGAGVRYLANLATTASFAGGLDIQTNSGIGFEATGATINVAASAGIERIRAATGQILNWTGATVAATGVSFETLATSGVVAAGDAMLLSNVDGGVFNGGNVTVAGTAAGDGIDISGGSAATFNFASATVDNTSAHGINLSGANGAVTFTAVNIDGTTGSGLNIANSTGGVTVGGGSIGGATPATAAGVVISGQVSGTIALNGLAVTASGADAYSLGGNAGTVNVTGGSATQNGAEDVFDIDNGSGAITVSAAITHSGATGQAVEIDGTSGAVTFSGNVVANAGAQLFNIGTNAAPTGGTILFSGASLTATNGGSAVIAGLGAGATVNVTGLLTVDGATGTALSIANAAGTVNLGGVTITNSGGDGIALTANGGTVTFGGTTSVTNPATTFAAVDIEGANGAISFDDLEIVLGSATTTGLDLSGNTTIDANITAGDFDVDGGGFAGTLGVDLSGAQGTGVVRLGDPTNVGGETSRIINAANGVRFTAATDLGELTGPGDYDGFIFGDGAGPAESVITVSGFVIDGVLPANGSYNFLDATLTGVTSNLSGGAEAYYVDQLGTGDGSAADPGSAVGAENSATADVIVLLNTARTGGVDVIDLLLGVHNTGSLQLDAGQFLIAYSNGDTAIDLADFGFVGGGAPANFKLTGINNSTIVPVPGGLEAGKPLLTTGAANNTVTLGAGAFVNGVTIGNTGSGFGILGTGGLADIRNSIVTGGTNGGISLSNATGATLDNLDINGGLLFTNASGAVDADDVDISGASALQITGGNANFDFDAASSIANTSGTAVSIANRGGGGFVFAGTVASNGAGAGGISITGATAANTVTFSGTVNLGTTTALGAGAGVDIDNNGTASTVSFNGGLDIVTSGTSGFVAGNGGTVNVSGAGNTIGATGAAAVDLGGLAANITLDAITASGPGTGVQLVDLAAGSTFSVVNTTTLSNYATAGIRIADTGGLGNNVAISFGAVAINLVAGTTGGTGILVENITENLNLDFGAIAIGNATGATTTGLVVDNIAGAGFDLDLASLDIENVQSGMFVDNLDAGSMTVTGATRIDDATLDGIVITNSAANATFGGLVTILNDGGAAGDGVDLGTDAGGANTGTYAFNGGVDITVNGAGAFGFRATSSGTVNIVDPVGTTSQITSNNGTALLINPTAVNMVLDSITSGGGVNGISLTAMSGSLTVGTVNIDDSTGDGLFITGLVGTVNLGIVAIDGSGGDGIQIDATTATGAVTISGGTIGGTTDPAGRGVFINGGSGAVAINADIAKSNAGKIVQVDGRTGGTVSFGGDLSASGGVDNGLSFNNNTGGTTSFTAAGSVGIVVAGVNNALAVVNSAAHAVGFAGTSTLTTTGSGNAVDISNGATLAFTGTSIAANGTGTALQADGGGTVTITGTGALGAGTTATAVDLSSVAIGAGGVNFASTNKTAGGTSAVIMNTVTGTGTVALGTGTLDGGSGAVIRIGDGAGGAGTGGTAGLSYGGNIVSGATITSNAVNIQDRQVSAQNVTLSGNITHNTNAIGILIDTIAAGTISFNGAGAKSITSSGSSSIAIAALSAGSAVNFSGGAITATSAANTINIANSSGTVTFSNQVTATTTGGGFIGVNLFNNAGNTTSFTGGLDIQATAAGGSGFSATSGGTVVVSGSGNTIQTTTGTLLTLTNVTVGASGAGIAFDTVSNSGAANGILVDTVAQAAGSTGIDISGGSIANATTRGVDINATSADVAIAASISTGAGGRSVEVTNSGRAGGSQIAFSGAIDDDDNLGINLDNNDVGGVATITFSGGLDIDTTTAAGFNATNGGTIVVTGATNTIDTTTGTALNIANTNIGAAGLTFLRISSNGAASGIVLNNTGTAGGLTVTGDGGGANNGSGGTIQNSTGDGISLTNTAQVRLARMNVTNNLGDGIGGSTINGFLIERLNISGNGNDAASDESGINIAELTGSTFAGTNPTGIVNSVISNNHEFEVQITNTAGTLTDFRLTTNTISSNGLSGSHGNLVNFLALGSANMTLNTSGGTFTGAAPNTATGLHIDHSGTSGLMTANISGGTFTNNNVAVSVSAAIGGNLDFSVDGTTSTGNRAHGLNLFVSANATGTVTGSFTNNTVGTVGVPNSGAELGFGIRVQNEGVDTTNPVTVLIDSNQVRGIGAVGTGFSAININQGIAGQATSKTTNVTITNNSFRDVYNGRAIVVSQNNSTNATSAGTTNVSIHGNILDLASIAGQVGDGTVIRLRRLDANGGVFNVAQAAATAAAIANELDDANGFNDPARISISGTPTYNQPAPPLPLMAASNGVEAFGEDLWGDVLTGDTLDSLIAAAIDRWAATGLTDEQLAALNAVTFEIADLGGNYLGLADGNHVRLDDDGNGAGWYVDATPLTDEEFANRSGDTQLLADGTQAPAGQYDLLTTIMHEMGHVLGLGDTYALDRSSTLMYGWLTTGERRLPNVIYSPQDTYYSASMVE